MVPGRLKRVAAVAVNTFRETVRERVLYNLVFFAILMTVSGLVLRDLSVRQDDKIIKDIGLASIDVFGTLIAVLIGVSLVNKEIERRSLYPLLTKPLTRGEFLLGKFSGLALTLLVNVGVMTAGLYLTLLATRMRSVYVARALDPNLLVAVVVMYAGMLLVVALALVFSVVTSPGMAAICTVAMVAVGRYADMIRNMGEVLPSVPQWIPRTLYYVLPNFAHFDLKDRAVHGVPAPADAVLWILLYGVAYSAVALGVAIFALRRRDLQ
jgi:ABC-type transport system involved in multi-copper enzyme maturation permease subunit